MANQNEKDTMQSINVAEVAGYLKQLDLEKDKDADKNNIIRGSVSLQYGAEPDEQVQVKIYKKEKTSGGNVAKAYEKLEQLMANHITFDKRAGAVEATEESEAIPAVEATILRIYGSGDFTPQVQLNEYHPEGGEYSARPEVSMGFGNISIDSIGKEKFKGQFDMVLFLTKDAKMEVDKEGDETGNLVVEGLYVNYKNEVKPLLFIAEDEDIVEGMSGLERGNTIQIWGDIKIARIVKAPKETKSSFGGKAKVEEGDVSYVSKLSITGGEPVEEDDERFIDPAFVKKALVVRETMLEEMTKKAEGSSKPKTGGGFKPSKPSVAKPKVKGKTGIPF